MCQEGLKTGWSDIDKPAISGAQNVYAQEIYAALAKSLPHARGEPRCSSGPGLLLALAPGIFGNWLLQLMRHCHCMATVS